MRDPHMVSSTKMWSTYVLRTLRYRICTAVLLNLVVQLLIILGVRHLDLLAYLPYICRCGRTFIRGYLFIFIIVVQLYRYVPKYIVVLVHVLYCASA